ncbi:hypothetical protein VTI74DRAFT_1336 [Chaetomium olivicolor]
MRLSCSSVTTSDETTPALAPKSRITSMTPKKAAAAAENASDIEAGGANEPSQSDLKLAFAILKHLKGKPEVNWAEYCAEYNTKEKIDTARNTGGAYERFRLFRNRHGLTWESTGVATPARKGKKSAVATPAATTDNVEDDEGAGGDAAAAIKAKSVPATPAKRSRKKSTAAATGTTPATAGKKLAASIFVAAPSPAGGETAVDAANNSDAEEGRSCWYRLRQG